VSLLGLACDLVGSVFIVRGLIISKRDAIKLGISRVSGNTDEENLQLPQVKDRLKQSRNAKIGSAFLFADFVLQGYASL